jgi:hypothetical protein
MRRRSLFAVSIEGLVSTCVVLTLGGQLFIVNNIEEILIARRILTLYSLCLLGLRSLGRIGVERDTTVVVVDIYGCGSLSKTCIFFFLLVPCFNQSRWITAWFAAGAPRPQLITCPVESLHSMPLRALCTPQ